MYKYEWLNSINVLLVINKLNYLETFTMSIMLGEKLTNLNLRNETEYRVELMHSNLCHYE